MADEEKKKDGGILKNKELMNALASALDPEAARIVDRLLSRIPEGSWLRGATADRLLGIVKSLVESEAGKKGPVVGVVGEKFTDYLDIGRTGLSDRNSKEAKRKVTEVDPVQWMNRFFQHAEKRLAEAENPEKEQTRLNAEFQARKAILDLIKEAEEAARAAEVTEVADPVAPATEVDWDEKWKTVQEKAKAGWSKVDAVVAKAAPRLNRFAGFINRKGDEWRA